GDGGRDARRPRAGPGRGTGEPSRPRRDAPAPLSPLVDRGRRLPALVRGDAGPAAAVVGARRPSAADEMGTGAGSGGLTRRPGRPRSAAARPFSPPRGRGPPPE